MAFRDRLRSDVASLKLAIEWAHLTRLSPMTPQEFRRVTEVT